MAMGAKATCAECNPDGEARDPGCMACDPHGTTMARAFALVAPEKFGARDWREPVNAWVTARELDAAGVSIDAVREAVEYFTATEASVSAAIAGRSGGGIGYLVRALGYRRGPAGP